MKYNTVFWDWNGTIIDDLQASIDSVNAMLKKRGLTYFATPDDYYKVFCFPVIEYYKKAGFDFSEEPFEVLAVEYIDNYNAVCRKCEVFPDVLDAIIRFKEAGIRQIVLSASEHDGLCNWLSEVGILSYFDDVIGNDNIYAVGKADIALNYLDEHKDICTDRAVMVGDTVHDTEVAKAMGIDIVVIPRGHNSRADLEEVGVTVVSNGNELINYVEKACKN